MTRDELIAAGCIRPERETPDPRTYSTPVLRLDDRGRVVAERRIANPFDRRELTEDFAEWLAPKRRKRKRAA